MVEADRGVAAELERERALFGAAQVEIVRGDGFAFLDTGGAEFDVVFLDPPFRQNALPALLERLPKRLVPRARVYAEAPAPLEPGAGWHELRRARAGQVSFQLFEWRGDHKSDLPGNV
jgi:16S rRNA (guanine966-N2)-methyltransferase